MILTIDKQADVYLVDERSEPGSPSIGRGFTLREAVGIS